MAYETKVILSLLAQRIGEAKNVREAYNVIVEAANVEGVSLPDYDEYKQRKKKKNPPKND